MDNGGGKPRFGREEEDIMYGQAKRKSYEVRLVRVSPWDNRVYRRDRSRKTAEKVLTIALSMCLTLSACLGIVYFYFQPGAEETRIVAENEILSAGRPEESVGAAEQEIVVMEEPEPKIPVIVIDPGHGGDADIYISIHQNACEEQESPVQGIETWYCGKTEGSRRLAQLVHKGALEKTGARNRELCDSTDLYVIREASMPACLIETGFLSNSEERKRMMPCMK